MTEAFPTGLQWRAERLGDGSLDDLVDFDLLNPAWSTAWAR